MTFGAPKALEIENQNLEATNFSFGTRRATICLFCLLWKMEEGS